MVILSPEAILETATIYYSAKVAVALKNMILPNKSLEEIKTSSLNLLNEKENISDVKIDSLDKDD